MACPTPPLAPRCVAVRRKDVRHGLCALLGGPPVAVLLNGERLSQPFCLFGVLGLAIVPV